MFYFKYEMIMYKHIMYINNLYKLLEKIKKNIFEQFITFY